MLSFLLYGIWHDEVLPLSSLEDCCQSIPTSGFGNLEILLLAQVVCIVKGLVISLHSCGHLLSQMHVYNFFPIRVVLIRIIILLITIIFIVGMMCHSYCNIISAFLQIFLNYLSDDFLSATLPSSNILVPFCCTFNRHHMVLSKSMGQELSVHASFDRGQ